MSFAFFFGFFGFFFGCTFWVPQPWCRAATAGAGAVWPVLLGFAPFEARSDCDSHAIATAIHTATLQPQPQPQPLFRHCHFSHCHFCRIVLTTRSIILRSTPFKAHSDRHIKCHPLPPSHIHSHVHSHSHSHSLATATATATPAALC
jgi:hypothetical protein